MPDYFQKLSYQINDILWNKALSFFLILFRNSIYFSLKQQKTRLQANWNKYFSDENT